jgi:2-keto-4-pentenoate hydratase/2-oxohepta-3-ene-1,7-dioic acid hydratase in catechol pathway
MRLTRRARDSTLGRCDARSIDRFAGAPRCIFRRPRTLMAQPVQIARYLAAGRAHYGRIDGESLERWSAAPWLGGRATGERDAREGSRLLPPSEPTKIVCVGLNYVEHIAESASVLAGTPVSEEPLLFLKPPSAAIAHGDAIRYPEGVTRMDPEAEMALVIGRRATRVREDEAAACIAGVTAFNDVSARNYQRADGQWARAKGFDTFAPFGPWIALGLDPNALDVECRVNGTSRQRGNTSQLRFRPAFLVHYISRIMTLEPGDVIATGTPAGVAPIVAGDLVEVEVSGVGVLANRVEPA